MLLQKLRNLSQVHFFNWWSFSFRTSVTLNASHSSSDCFHRYKKLLFSSFAPWNIHIFISFPPLLFLRYPSSATVSIPMYRDEISRNSFTMSVNILQIEEFIALISAAKYYVLQFLRCMWRSPSDYTNESVVMTQYKAWKPMQPVGVLKLRCDSLQVYNLADSSCPAAVERG